MSESLSAEEILDLWITKWGGSSDWGALKRNAFLARPQVAELSRLPSTAVRQAILDKRELRDILNRARETRPQEAEPSEPEPLASIDVPWIEAAAEIGRAGSWWRRIRGRTFSLVVDGRDTAQITRASYPTGAQQFDGVASLMRTDVMFDDGTVWVISARPPDPTRTTTFGGTETKMVSRSIGDRVVEVEQDRQIMARGWVRSEKRSWVDDELDAWVDSGAANCKLSATWGVVSGPRGPGGGSHKWTISRSGRLRLGGWSIEANEPVPLPVVLLHWHLVTRDWTAPSSGGLGGNGG